MMVISKIEYYFSESKIKFEENSIEFNDFQNCKVLIEINSDKINFKKYKESFHINNKIIKNIFLNFLSILKDINANISQNILEIFNLSKKSKFKTIINDHIKNNSLIYNKINEVIRNDNSPENANYIYNNHMNGNPQLNGNCIKRDIPIPFLPPKREDDNREYTLVLDLDETLVHFFEDNNEAYVKVRMGAECFISILSQFCEIVIFTASTKFYADTVIDGLDCKDLIDHKLYREHTYDYNGINVKDLSKLGRDLNKVIIIDNIEENYMFQPNNGLNIIDFEGDENDNELDFLLKDLLELVKQPGKNVCEELPIIRRNMQKRYTNIS
jgi:Dullard-like phosphatase family protein